MEAGGPGIQPQACPHQLGLVRIRDEAKGGLGQKPPAISIS